MRDFQLCARARSEVSKKTETDRKDSAERRRDIDGGGGGFFDSLIASRGNAIPLSYICTNIICLHRREHPFFLPTHTLKRTILARQSFLSSARVPKIAH